MTNSQRMLAALAGDKNARAHLATHDPVSWKRLEAALSTTGNELGGALVPDLLLDEVLRVSDPAGLSRRCFQIEARGGRSRLPKLGEAVAAWVGEGQTIPETTFSTSSVGNGQLGKVAATVVASAELAEDALNFPALAAEELGRALGRGEDRALLQGDGTSGHGGHVGLCFQFENDASLKGRAAASTATLASLVLADFTQLLGKLPARWHNDAAWIMGSEVFEQLARVTGGQLPNGRFLGRPVLLSEYMPTPASGRTLALFGSLRDAATRMYDPVQRLRISPHAKWDSDGLALKAVRRVSLLAHGIGDSAKAGPVVALVAP